MKALKITAIGFFSFLLALFAWLVLQADPMGGEPVHLVVLDRAKAPSADHVAQKRREEKKAASEYQNTLIDGKFPPLPKVDPAKLLDSQAKRSEASVIRAMSPVPLKALVEKSKYGSLPKISDDGRRVSEIYARPFNLALRPKVGQPKRIAILVSGMGLSAVATHNAIHNLPGPVTLAFNPYGNHLQGWVRKARQLGHEVLLEVPLEPYDYPENDPGPHTLLTSLAKEENINRLQWIMGRFTGYVAVTNSMGEKFLTSGESLLPIFQELHRRGVSYFEDGGGSRSEASKLAKTVGMGFSEADLKIDSIQSEKAIRTKLSRLVELANKRGFAIGVGSSLPLTIDLISEWSKTLRQKNIILVPVSAAIRSYQPS